MQKSFKLAPIYFNNTLILQRGNAPCFAALMQPAMSADSYVLVTSLLQCLLARMYGCPLTLTHATPNSGSSYIFKYLNAKLPHLHTVNLLLLLLLTTPCFCYKLSNNTWAPSTRGRCL